MKRWGHRISVVFEDGWELAWGGDNDLQSGGGVVYQLLKLLQHPLCPLLVRDKAIPVKILTRHSPTE